MSRLPARLLLSFALAGIFLANSNLEAGAVPTGSATATALKTDYKVDPIGIDTLRPRLSWELRGEARGIAQSAYQIRVASDERSLLAGRRLTWDSGVVKSDASILRPYDGPALVSGQRCYWQVRVWDGAGIPSGWSEPAYWEMGLVAPADWKAKWIEPSVPGDPAKSGPTPMLRREFAVRGPVAQARAYVTSHGLYELEINGRKVGDQVLTPGWTSYNKRLQYQTYDVTSLLKTGANAVGATLGDGWYRGNLAWDNRRNVYGSRVALLAQIAITYRDGRKEIVSTDAAWKSATGPILMSEIYAGETYDARLEQAGWSSPGFNDGSWSGVTVAENRFDTLVSPAGPPVRRTEEIKPKSVLKTPAGLTVVDMGQNMVGWVRLEVQGGAGTTVTLRHAEVLDKQGEFYVANLRGAAQTVRYTLKGGGVETFEPHFTFQGFRYVAIDGYPGPVTTDAITGVVVHSDMARTGEFETSKPLVNQLQHNIVWGQKGNFVDVPTDCPQRDERLGWTGDAQVFSNTAAFNMDVAGFFTKWLDDLAADQLENGSVPHVVPDVISRPGNPAAGSAAWADSAVIIPWNMYQSYGDPRFLEAQYPSMVRWVEYMRSRAGKPLVWAGDPHFGDWLAFASTDSDYPGATTGKDLIATAFFAHSTDLLQRAARVLGKQADAAKYGDLFEQIKLAFRREFVTEAGRVGENTQTAYAVALQFDLLPESLRANAASRLAREIRERKHLTTGFVGTPYLCHVLARFGYLDEAYMLVNRETYPSWLYPVKQGATTIWERWDGVKPDGSFQDAGMNSFNHYAYGAIGEWMYRVMAGLGGDPEAPGYKHALIAPRPGGGFTSARAALLSVYGRVSSSWSLENGVFELTVEVPPNTTALVTLPNARLADATEGGRPIVPGKGVTAVRQEGEAVVVAVGSGTYRFGSRYQAAQR
jgi:alpha-L-rhamnosidase